MEPISIEVSSVGEIMCGRFFHAVGEALPTILLSVLLWHASPEGFLGSRHGPSHHGSGYLVWFIHYSIID